MLFTADADVLVSECGEGCTYSKATVSDPSIGVTITIGAGVFLKVGLLNLTKASRLVLESTGHLEINEGSGTEAEVVMKDLSLLVYNGPSLFDLKNALFATGSGLVGKFRVCSRAEFKGNVTTQESLEVADDAEAALSDVVSDTFTVTSTGTIRASGVSRVKEVVNRGVATVIGTLSAAAFQSSGTVDISGSLNVLEGDFSGAVTGGGVLSAGPLSHVKLNGVLNSSAVFEGSAVADGPLEILKAVTVAGSGWLYGAGTVTNRGELSFESGAKFTDLTLLLNSGVASIQSPSQLNGVAIDNSGTLRISNANSGGAASSTKPWKNSGVVELGGTLGGLEGFTLENNGVLQVASSCSGTVFGRVVNAGAINVTSSSAVAIRDLELNCSASVYGEGSKVAVGNLVVRENCLDAVVVPWDVTLSESTTVAEGSRLVVTGSATVKGAVEGAGKAFFQGKQTIISGENVLVDLPETHFKSGSVVIGSRNMQCSQGKVVFDSCAVAMSDGAGIAGEAQVVYKNVTLGGSSSMAEPSYINASTLVQGSTIKLNVMESLTFGGSKGCTFEDSTIEVNIGAVLLFHGPKECTFRGGMVYKSTGHMYFNKTTVYAEDAAAAITTKPNVYFQSSTVYSAAWVFESAGLGVSDTALRGSYNLKHSDTGLITDSRLVNATVNITRGTTEIRGELAMEESTVNNNGNALCAGCTIRSSEVLGRGASVLRNDNGMKFAGMSLVRVSAENNFQMSVLSSSSVTFESAYEQSPDASIALEDGSRVNFTGTKTALLGSISGNGAVDVQQLNATLGLTLSGGAKLTCGYHTKVTVAGNTVVRSGSEMTFKSSAPVAIDTVLDVEGKASFCSETQCTAAAHITCSNGGSLAFLESVEVTKCPLSVSGSVTISNGKALTVGGGVRIEIESSGKMAVQPAASFTTRDAGHALENKGTVELSCSSSVSGLKNVNTVKVLPCDSSVTGAKEVVLSRGVSEGTITVDSGASLSVNSGFESSGAIAGAGEVCFAEGSAVCGTVSSENTTFVGNTDSCGPTTFEKAKFKQGSSLSAKSLQSGEVIFGTLEVAQSAAASLALLENVVVRGVLTVSSGSSLVLKDSKVALPEGASGDLRGAMLNGTGALTVNGELALGGTVIDAELNCGSTGTLVVHSAASMSNGGVCSGTVRLQSNALLTLDKYTLNSAKVTGAGTLTLHGACTLRGDSSSDNGVAVSVESTADLEIDGSLSVQGNLRLVGGGSRLAGGVLVGRGSTVIEGTGYNLVGFVFENYGRAEWAGAQFASASSESSFVNAGVFSVTSLAGTAPATSALALLENKAEGQWAVSIGDGEARYFPCEVKNYGSLSLEKGNFGISGKYTSYAGSLLNFTGGNIIASSSGGSVSGTIVGSGKAVYEGSSWFRLEAGSVLSPGSENSDSGELWFVGTGARSGFSFQGQYTADINDYKSVDVVHVEGASCLFSKLTINATFAPGFTPKVGDIFVVFTSSTETIKGSLKEVNYRGIDPLAVTHHQNNNSVTIEVIGCPFGTKDNVKNCVHCQPGEYFKGDTQKCLPCAKGSYSDKPDATECTLCPEGTASSEVGASSCSPCGVGYFANGTGLDVCFACPM